MSENIRKLFVDNIQKAIYGREVWSNIESKYDIYNGKYALLMPTLNKEYNYYGLLYLNQFLEKFKIDEVIILTVDERVIKCANLFSDKISNVIKISEKDLDCLLEFYCFYLFSEKLIIISLEQPNGRNVNKLIGQRGITVEELIAIGLFKLAEFKKEEKIQYHGDDKDIEEFFDI